nr:MAG: hypothetical protein DIU80_23250 [Chloroflexota bacterium]
MAKDPTTILLCATRFWVSAGVDFPLTTPTLRAGVRTVARAQGLTPAELDKAERALVRRGYITKPRRGVVALTPRGAKVSRKACYRVQLTPWNWEASYYGRLDGVRGQRRRRRR